MPYYKVPMLIDVSRLTTDQHANNVTSLVEYLKRAPGGFNYNRASVCQQKVYQGYTDLDALYRHCLGQGDKVERVQNARVVKLISPFALNRNAKVIQLPRRSLALSKEILSPMGPTFALLENGILKLVYLHCRNGHRASVSDLSFWAAVQKYEILENEYFGLPTDFEIINVGSRNKNGEASVELLNSSDLALPSFEEVKVRTGQFLRAFKEVDEQKLAGERRSPKGRRDDSRIQPVLPF